jgi:integrase
VAGSVPRGIRKRTNSAGQARYQVRYLVRDPNSPSGWVETSSTFATMREARAFKADRDGEAAIGARRFDPRLGRASLSAIWTQYRASKQPAVSPKTWSGYAQHWELRIGPRFGHVPVDEISRKDVQQFIGGLTVGPWAKLATLRLLRSSRHGSRGRPNSHQPGPGCVIRSHSGAGASPLPLRHGSRHPGNRLRRPRRHRDNPGLTGLRWSELVGLRVGDIDLKARRLYVRQAAPDVEGRIIVGPPKTRAAVRTVPLPQIVIDALKPRIQNRSPKEQAITSPNGGFLRSNNWRRHTHWNKALKKTGLAPLTIHDLRHTYASLARKSGADLRYVQKTMGHSTPTVTANIYSDLYSDELDHVATNLDRLNDVAKHQANGQEPDTPEHP